MTVSQPAMDIPRDVQMGFLRWLHDKARRGELLDVHGLPVDGYPVAAPDALYEQAIEFLEQHTSFGPWANHAQLMQAHGDEEIDDEEYEAAIDRAREASGSFALALLDNLGITGISATRVVSF